MVVCPQKVGSASLYMEIAPNVAGRPQGSLKDQKGALAYPNIPTFCGYIGMDRKGKKRAQGREIQLVGMDKRKGWGLLPVLMWEEEEEELMLPEPEAVRKELWGTLGAVGSHTNAAKNNCYRFYEPRMDRDGKIEVGMGFMEWELKEIAPIKEQVEEVHPGRATTSPYSSSQLLYWP